MNTQEVPKFDHLWHDATVAFGELTKYRRRLALTVQKVRRHTYRFTRDVKLMNEHYHSELLALITSEQTTIQAWMDDHFAMIEQMGDTRERIFMAIDNGVTEAEYVEEGEIMLCRKRVKVAAPTTEVAEPPAPKPTATPEEKLAHEKAASESLRSTNQTLRRELSQTRRDLAIAMRRIDLLVRDNTRARKALDHAVQTA